MTKRIFSGLMALFIVFTVTSCNSGTGKNQPKTYEKFTTPVVVGQNSLADATYSDEYIDKESSEYSYDLALLCSILSSAAYYSQDEVSISLTNLGFSEERTYNYDSDKADKVAYTLASREFDGVKTVIAVLRGSIGSEWQSNFNIAESAYLNGDNSILAKGYHEGFYNACDEFLTSLDTYCQQVGNVGRVLITGHSRGGAVSNLAAAKLCEMGNYKVFCYTFAAPNVKIMTEEEKTFEGYNCIFNIANPEDTITYMPLSQWGFELYGKILKFEKTDTAAYDAFLINYEELVGAAYDGGFENGSDDVEACFSSLAVNVPDLDVYYKTDGSSAYKTLNSLSDALSGGEFDYGSLILSAAMSGTADFLTFFIGNGDTVNEEHAAQTYLSWMQVEGIFETAAA